MGSALVASSQVLGLASPCRFLIGQSGNVTRCVSFLEEGPDLPQVLTPPHLFSQGPALAWFPHGEGILK